MISEFKNEETSINDYMKLVFTLGQAIQLPICIGLTLRVAKKKKTTPVIPKEPVFHNDPYLETSEVNENQMELVPISQILNREPKHNNPLQDKSSSFHAGVIPGQNCVDETSHHL